MKQYLLSIIIVVSGTSVFASSNSTVELLNQHQMRSRLSETLTQLNQDRAEMNKKIYKGMIYNELKNQNYSHQNAFVCDQVYKGVMKRYMKTQIDMIEGMQQLVSDESFTELSKGFSVKPESTALGGVALFKMKRLIQSNEQRWNNYLNQAIRKTSCEALKQDHKMLSSMNEFTTKIIENLNQTTLSVE